VPQPQVPGGLAPSFNEVTLSGIDAELRAVFPVPKRDRNTKSPLQNIHARADEEQVAPPASVMESEVGLRLL
jgi:hypothetical protein